jgi:hypothetical protein
MLNVYSASAMRRRSAARSSSVGFSGRYSW